MMVERIDLFHIPFYKKEAFTGSDRGVRFWIGRTEAGDKEEKKAVLRAIMWPEPYALKHTPDEKKIRQDFAFSEEGLDAVYEWILGAGRDAVLQTNAET